jgi:hypothetical protein
MNIHALPQEDWILSMLQSPHHQYECHWVNGQNGELWKVEKTDNCCCKKICNFRCDNTLESKYPSDKNLQILYIF